VEHVERQDDREQAIREELDEREQDGDRMDERTDELQSNVDQAREDFRSKQKAEDVPGAQPPGGGEPGREPPEEADEVTPGD
jgi:hypothetical protein